MNAPGCACKKDLLRKLPGESSGYSAGIKGLQWGSLTYFPEKTFLQASREGYAEGSFQARVRMDQVGGTRCGLAATRPCTRFRWPRK
jgi:hypothetical protein